MRARTAVGDRTKVIPTLPAWQQISPYGAPSKLLLNRKKGSVREPETNKARSRRVFEFCLDYDQVVSSEHFSIVHYCTFAICA